MSPARADEQLVRLRASMVCEGMEAEVGIGGGGGGDGFAAAA